MGIGIVCLGVTLLMLLSSKNSSKDIQPVVLAGSTIHNPYDSIQYFEERVRKQPEDVGYRLALAQAYLQHAVEKREEAIYLPKTEQLLEEILKKHPSHYEALALKASLYNTLHQFEEARDIASELIQRNGDRAYIYGLLVDALVELGEYAEAVRICDEMLKLKPGLPSYARASYLRELHGDAKGALEAMNLAVEAGIPGSVERSWAMYQMGQLLMAENELYQAAMLFEGILEERPGYAFAINGLGQVQLVHGNYQDALRLFEQAYSIVPAEEMLEGIAEAYDALNNKEGMQDALQRIENSLLEADAFGENVRMEYADFLADVDQNIPEALELARIEYERRPMHLHALETYAWALHKSGRSKEARPYIEQAMRT